ncbi:hypothetical protein HOP50_11g62370 [Chloropicon primus]|nr:hypothetical protein HOP50_11g62370 [Chloropicon primus]
MDITSAVVHQLAAEGKDGCTLVELWALAEKYVLPCRPTSEVSAPKKQLFADLLERSEVEFLDKAGAQVLRKALKRGGPADDPLSQLVGRAGELRVACTENRRQICLLDGRVTLFHVLNDTDKKFLEVLGKKRNEGVLMKNFEEHTKVSQHMAYATIQKLEEYGLVVTRSVLLVEDKKDSRVSTQPNKVIYLPCFVPQEGTVYGERPDLKPTFTDSEKGQAIKEEAIEMLKVAPNHVLRSYELRQYFNVKQSIWKNLVSSWLKDKLVEECYVRKGEKRTALCLKLCDTKKSGGEEAASKCSGTHVFAESYPLMDVMHLVKESASEGVDGIEAELKCWLNGKTKNKLFKSLEDQKLLTKEKVLTGRAVGWKYKLAGVKTEPDVRLDPMISDKGLTKQNRLRMSFLLNLLKDREFVFLSQLRELYQQHVEASGLKDEADIFADRKSARKAVAELEKKGRCHLHPVNLFRKTTMAGHESKVVLRQGLEFDDAMRKKVEAVANEKTSFASLAKKNEMKVTQFDEVMEVDSISHLINKDKPGKPGLLNAEQGKPDVPKKEETAEGEKKGGVCRGNIRPVQRKSEYWKTPVRRLHGMISGSVARAKAVHGHLWALQHARGSEILDLKKSATDMTVEQYTRLIGIYKVPQEVLKEEYSSSTRISEFPSACQEVLLNKESQNLYMSAIRVLTTFGLLRWYINMESDELNPKLDPYVIVSKSAHIRIGEDLPSFSEQDFGFAIRKRERLEQAEEVEFALETEDQCEAYWNCLERTFRKSKFDACKRAGLFPASEHKGVCMDQKWAESLLSSTKLTLRIRAGLMQDLSKIPREEDLLRSTSTLVAKYGVDEEIVTEFARSWGVIYRKLPGKKRRKRGEKEKAPAPAMRRYTESEDANLVVAFATALVLQGGDAKKIQWGEISWIPNDIRSSLSKRLTKLRKNETIASKLQEISHYCIQNDKERVNMLVDTGAGQLENYPERLRKLVRRDNKLGLGLKSLGEDFALGWFKLLEELQKVVQQEVAEMMRVKDAAESARREAKERKRLSAQQSTQRKSVQASKKRRRATAAGVQQQQQHVPMKFEALPTINFLNTHFHTFMNDGQIAPPDTRCVVHKMVPRAEGGEEGRLLSFLYLKPGVRESAVTDHFGGDVDSTRKLLSSCVSSGLVKEVASSKGTMHYFLA